MSWWKLNPPLAERIKPMANPTPEQIGNLAVDVLGAIAGIVTSSPSAETAIVLIRAVLKSFLAHTDDLVTAEQVRAEAQRLVGSLRDIDDHWSTALQAKLKR